MNCYRTKPDVDESHDPEPTLARQLCECACDRDTDTDAIEASLAFDRAVASCWSRARLGYKTDDWIMWNLKTPRSRELFEKLCRDAGLDIERHHKGASYTISWDDPR